MTISVACMCRVAPVVSDEPRTPRDAVTRGRPTDRDFNPLIHYDESVRMYIMRVPPGHGESPRGVIGEVSVRDVRARRVVEICLHRSPLLMQEL